MDLSLAGLPALPPRGEAILSLAWLRSGAAAYLAGRPLDTPLASPLLADLRGLPPLFIQVGGDDLLLEEARHLVEKVQAAGGDARLNIHTGLWHVFQLHAGILRASDAALDEAATFLRRPIL